MTAQIWNRLTGNTGTDAQVAQAAKFNEIASWNQSLMDCLTVVGFHLVSKFGGTLFKALFVSQERTVTTGLKS